MMKNILALAEEFQNKITKTADKKRLSRSRISKALEKAKIDYAKSKKDLDVLEANDAKLKSQLEGTRSAANSHRSNIMKMHQAIQKMDLSNARDAVFYEDGSEDVSYVIDGKEFALTINDVGDVEKTPMNQYRKSKKAPKKDVQCVDEGCADDSHGHPIATTPEEEVEDFDQLYNSLME